MTAAATAPVSAGADGPPIRHAATIVLLRRTEAGPRLLMGQRGSGAVFMPDKFVFPGGALDPEDLALAAAEGIAEADARLLVGTPPDRARALRHAAIRELREETGLSLPAPDALRFFFRAVTPPGMSRRFDARFFLADAAAIAGQPDDFTGAQDELRFLSWLTLEEARGLDLPFITEIVLAEIAAHLAAPEAARGVPYFNHTDLGSHFHLLRA